MASTNPFTSFTITQPFLGAPLQFQPALGSQELEELIDAFVTGSSSKQEKFSEVTIDFYNNATVDLNTGALVRQYNVYPSSLNTSPWAFEQSPTQSQSSGFSPPIFTPSPGSSAANLGDSGYASISSLTPPNRTRNVGSSGRVSKKPKKETKKAAEIRLPGFSIMTKDGIDVTSSAGRGTKTKEQREHAHLMRIMKACDDCKRKKVRCDPSHRRSHNDMSRTSTSTTYTSSSRPHPSPPISAPSLSRETTNVSQISMPTFGNAIDDFVLFPEDTASWNADLPIPEDYDLSQFNFDINDIGLNDFPPMNPDQSFYSPLVQQQSSFQLGNQLGQSHQHGMAQWDDPQSWMSVDQCQTNPTTSPQDSAQPDSTRWTQDEFAIPAPARAPARAPASPWAGNYRLDGLVDHPNIANGLDTNDSPSSFSSADWSIIESSVNANISPQVEDGHSPGLSRAISRQQVRSRQAGSSVERTAMHDIHEGIEAPSEHASLRRLGESDDSLNMTGLQHLEGDPCGCDDNPVPHTQHGRIHISQTMDRLPGETLGLDIICAQLSESLRAVKPASVEYLYLSRELQRLRTVLAQVKSGILSDNVIADLKNYAAELQTLHSHVKQLIRSVGQRQDEQDAEHYNRHLRQCQEQTKHFIRSLCATIKTVHQGDTSQVHDQPLTSGRNTQIYTLESGARGSINHAYSLYDGIQVLDNSSLSNQNSSSPDMFSVMVSCTGQGQRLDISDGQFDDAFRIGFAESRSAQNLGLPAGSPTVRNLPQHPLLVKTDNVATDMLRRISQPDFNPERITTVVTEQDRQNVMSSTPSFNEGTWQSMGLSIEFAPDHYADYDRPKAGAVQQGFREDTQFPHAYTGQSLVQGFERTEQTAAQATDTVWLLFSKNMGNSDENATSTQCSLIQGSQQLVIPVGVTANSIDMVTTELLSPVAQDAILESYASIEVVPEQSASKTMAETSISNVATTSNGVPATPSNFYYSMIFYATLLGSLALVMTSSLAIAPLTPWILPLIVFLGLPRQNTSPFISLSSLPMAVSLAYLGCLATFNQQSTKNIQFLRNICTEWTDTSSSPLITVVRLAFAAAIVAHTPRIISKVFGAVNGLSGLMVLASISNLITTGGKDTDKCGNSQTLSSSRPKADKAFASANNGSRHWLAMVRELSPDDSVVV